MRQDKIYATLLGIIDLSKKRDEANNAKLHAVGSAYSCEIEKRVTSMIDEVKTRTSTAGVAGEYLWNMLSALYQQAAETSNNADKLLGLYPVFAMLCGDPDSSEHSVFEDWLTIIDWSPLNGELRAAA